ncbi:alpha/beta fold hydrolase [Aeromicrobium sp. Leaf350]|uniref:alpha/beta fold hydrolase n=1 Tax=Aeromicrobium sp. Leaf350 TaxID=2876565 RepID=UPI001E291ECF|nr:alpha/beta fold hydrolase [Aeromicrobium sp. Leaf350]
MPLIDANGTRIHVTDSGGDGPAVVFGHGLLFSGWMFAAQVEALQGRYRCVTVDWRGQGQSPPAVSGGYDMDTLTDDLLGVLDALGLDAVHYVGLSMGGFVGMRLAARHPEKVLSLTLLDTSAGPEDPDKVSRYRLLARVYRLFGMGVVAKKVEPIMFAPGYGDEPAERALIEEWMSQLRKVTRSGMQQAIYGVTDRDPILAEIGSITAPTLVATGEHDVATPVMKAEVIAAAIPGARLVVIPGAGHSSTIERPGAVSDLIEQHLVTHG